MCSQYPAVGTASMSPLQCLPPSEKPHTVICILPSTVLRSAWGWRMGGNKKRLIQRMIKMEQGVGGGWWGEVNDANFSSLMNWGKMIQVLFLLYGV